MTVGSRLREARTITGLKQKEFAEKINEKAIKIKDMESDRLKFTHIHAEKVEENFNISGWWILTGRGSIELQSNDTNSSLTGSQNNNNIMNSNININTSTFDHSKDIEEIINLLRFAPSEFLHIVKDKLKKFKELTSL